MEQNNTQDQIKLSIQNIVVSSSALKNCLKNSLNLNNSNLEALEIDNFKACMNIYNSLATSGKH